MRVPLTIALPERRPGSEMIREPEGESLMIRVWHAKAVLSSTSRGRSSPERPCGAEGISLCLLLSRRGTEHGTDEGSSVLDSRLHGDEVVWRPSPRRSARVTSREGEEATRRSIGDASASRSPRRGKLPRAAPASKLRRLRGADADDIRGNGGDDRLFERAVAIGSMAGRTRTGSTAIRTTMCSTAERSMT